MAFFSLCIVKITTQCVTWLNLLRVNLVKWLLGHVSLCGMHFSHHFKSQMTKRELAVWNVIYRLNMFALHHSDRFIKMCHFYALALRFDVSCIYRTRGNQSPAPASDQFCLLLLSAILCNTQHSYNEKSTSCGSLVPNIKALRWAILAQRRGVAFLAFPCFTKQLWLKLLLKV